MEHENSVSGEGIKESEALMNKYSTQNFDGCSLIQFSQVNMGGDLNILPKLGLKLSITPSLIDEVKQAVLKSGSSSSFNGQEEANKTSDANAVTETMPRGNIVQRAKKHRAESFLISLLQIGSWKRVSRNESDLIAKCYFSKRKLAWEFLETDGLKRKIEIPWHDILSLRPVLPEGLYPGILEIELTQPPAFFHEIEPKPRKHTQWRAVSDFTEGQAATYRRHYLEFPPGALDRPLEKILKSDNRLFQMSQQDFPILMSPYFTKYAYRDSTLVNINPQLPQQLSFGNVPTFYPTYQAPPVLNSPASVVDSSEYGSNQMPPLEGQGGIVNVGDNVISNQITGTMMPSSNAAATSLQQVNSSMSFENNYLPLPENHQLEGLVPMQQPSMMFPTLNDHQQNMVLNSSQNGFPNSVTDDDLFMQGHQLGNNMTNDLVTPTMMPDNNSVLMSSGFSNDGGVGGGQMYPEVMNWPSDDQQFSSSVNPDDFNLDEIDNWSHDFNPELWQ